MMTVRDDAGGSLLGAIDGVNRVYRTSQSMRLDRVIDVYVNGFCRMAELDNGYSFDDARTVRIKEALLPGDTLSVRYNCTPVYAGIPNAQPANLVVSEVRLMLVPSVVEEDQLGQPVASMLRIPVPVVSRATCVA